MSRKTGIKVYAPASIGNFSTGYQIISVAVDHPGDEIIATFDNHKKGVEIDLITGFKAGLSRQTHLNSASLAGQLLLDHLGEKAGIGFRLHKGIPLNSGFSSNAASAVAGVFAVNELLGRPLEKYDLLPFAEQASSKFNIFPFPAQCSSILFGGIILHGNHNSDNFQKLYTPHGIHLTLLSPGIPYEEREKIALLTNQLSLEDQFWQAGKVAGMISALYTSNFNLLAESLQMHQPVDALLKRYPYFQDINELAISRGAWGCGFAGLGPGIFISSPNSIIADEISQQALNVLKKFKIEAQLIQTGINLNGVNLY